MLALAVRTGADRHRQDLGSLMLEARPPILRPRPLGKSAVASLVRASLGDEASAQLCRACAEATGGNPFLLSELLGEYRRDGRPTSEIDPKAVDRLAPERIAAAVLLRVSRLDPEAPALARSVAVLGEQARLSLCAQLAGVNPRKARTLAAGLVDLAVLDARRARYVSSTPSSGRRSMKICLPPSKPTCTHAPQDCWLISAPTPARSRCICWRPAQAVTAMSSPCCVRRRGPRWSAAHPTPPRRCSVAHSMSHPTRPSERWCLFELGNAEHEIGDTAALGHLREAGETATDPVIRARAFIALAWTTHPDARRQGEQLPFYERAAAEVGPHDRELALQLEAARLGALLFNPDLPAKFEDEAERFSGLPALTAAECLLRSFVARKALEGGPIAVAGDLAEQAAAHPALVSQGGHPLWRTNVTICLVEAERYEVAEHILSRAMRHAERNGSPQWLARALWLRGLARHRRGDLRAAEADGRAAVDLQGPASDYTKTPGLVVVIDSLADQGRADEGEALLAERGMDGELAPTLFSVLPLLARGRLRAAAGDNVRARADLEDALRRIQLSRGLFPWAVDAWVALVPVLRALGDDEAARAVAEKALAAATAAAVAAQDRRSAPGPRPGRGG